MKSKNKFSVVSFLIVGLAFVQPASSAVTVFADIETAGKAFDGIYDSVTDLTGPFSVRFLADTGGETLFGFGMLTSFDPSAVQSVNATYGTDWTFFNTPPAINNTAGSIETLANVGFLAPPVGGSSLLLYSVDFNPALTAVNFNLTNSVSPLGNQFLDGDGNPVNEVVFLSSEIRVVPVPAAFWLMLSSIAGWTWMRTRFSHA
jgi:hypothetical protein